MKELIVNADDFGRSEAINRGIAISHEQGIVTSASLMVEWPAAAAAAEYAVAHHRLGVGLHLDLGEWTYRGGSWLVAYRRVDLDDREAVTREIRRQLARFEDLLGRSPTHLDSHQHVHQAGAVREAVVAVAQTLGVPLRQVSPTVVYRGEFYGQTATGDPYPEGIMPSALIEIVTTLGDGVTELSCHPGIGESVSPYGAERGRETETLCDPRVRSVIGASEVMLRSFDGLPFHAP